jgi:hypothetical protein
MVESSTTSTIASRACVSMPALVRVLAQMPVRGGTYALVRGLLTGPVAVAAGGFTATAVDVKTRPLP